MNLMARICTLLVFLFSLSLVHAITSPITPYGTKLFYPNGTQFFIKGVVYSGIHPNTTDGSFSTPEQATVDILADGTQCARDLPYLKALGVNTISTYYLDWSQSHKNCFDIFAANDIWVLPLLSSNTATLIDKASASWNVTLYDMYTAAIDELSRYNNTLAAYVNFERITQLASEEYDSTSNNNTDLLPFIKAAARDTKAYIHSRSYRSIPIGYAVAVSSDVEFVKEQIEYLTCGATSDTVDFIGIDDTGATGWCGNSSFTQSGYANDMQLLAGTSVPLLFARYGCNTIKPRFFTQVPTIYGPQMTPLFSGGFVYEYFQNPDGYGLVDINGGTVQPNQDYTNLQQQLVSATPSPTASTASTPAAQATAACGAQNLRELGQVSPILPPRPASLICDCMMQSLSCTVPSNGASPASLGNQCSTYPVNCGGIQANGNNGSYGAYSMCGSSEQLAWVANQVYLSTKQPGDCTSVGQGAEVVTPAAPNATCNDLLQQAGPVGTGTVTNIPGAPTATSTTASVAGDSGLSTGAKTGIGVGVGVGAAAVGVVSLALWLVARRKKHAATKRLESDHSAAAPPELASNEIRDGEAAGLWPTILDHKSKGTPEEDRPPQELPGFSKPVELPAKT